MISKKTSLHAYHAFLYTILLSLHDYKGVAKGEMKFETLRIHFLRNVFATIADSHLSIYPYTILVVDPNTRLFTS